jgi:hypothetical protein
MDLEGGPDFVTLVFLFFTCRRAKGRFLTVLKMLSLGTHRP